MMLKKNFYRKAVQLNFFPVTEKFCMEETGQHYFLREIIVAKNIKQLKNDETSLHSLTVFDFSF